MKKLIFLLVTLALLIASCTKKESEKTINTADKSAIEGVWSRSFSMGKDVAAKVTYSIFKDSIIYKMDGPRKVNYTITKDSLVNENKWIGKSGETPYVVFIKNVSSKSITLLKMKTATMEDALKMEFPSDSARSKFSSWNTYKK